MIGTLSLTPWTPTVRRHPERGEIYAAETHYSRRHDGERTDVLRIYAHETLAPVGEIPIPNKIAAPASALPGNPVRRSFPPRSTT